MPETTVGLEESVETAPSGRFWIYGTGLALAAFAALCVAVYVSSTPWFLTHDAYPAMYESGYGMRLNHEDCDVVLYGDSSALTGLDPRIVQKITGLKTCNISEVGGVSVVVGSAYPIDGYLKNNKRPRFLLLMYSHNAVPPFSAPMTRYAPEGVLYGLQYEHSAGFYWNLLIRPSWMAKYSVWVGYSVLKDSMQRWTDSPRGTVADTRAERASLQGLYPFPLLPQKACVQSAQAIAPATIPASARVVDEMRRRYSAGGTQVIVNISPIPDCSVRLQDYLKMTAGLHDNALDAVPIRYFNDDDVHLSAEGETFASTEVGNQILALESQQAQGLPTPGRMR